MKIRLRIFASMAAALAVTILSGCGTAILDGPPTDSPRYHGLVLETVNQNWGYGASYKAIRVKFENDGTERSLTCTNTKTYDNYLCPFLKKGDRISFTLRREHSDVLHNKDTYETDEVHGVVRLADVAPSK